jgi:hypothetical protein
MTRVVTIRVAREEFKVDLDSELQIHDPDAERHKVAADVAWWGTVAARATAYHENLISTAEHWKNAALKACVEADEKMAEWKAKAQAGGHEKYLEIMRDVARASEEAQKAQAIHWAFVRKMDMLRSMLAGELGTQRASGEIGRVGPPEPKDPTGKTDPRLDGFRRRKHQET